MQTIMSSTKSIFLFFLILWLSSNSIQDERIDSKICKKTIIIHNHNFLDAIEVLYDLAEKLKSLLKPGERYEVIVWPNGQ